MRISESQIGNDAENPNVIRIVGNIPSASSEELERYFSERCATCSNIFTVLDNTSCVGYPFDAHIVFAVHSYEVVNEGGFYAVWGEFANFGNITPQARKYAEYLKKKVLDGCYWLDIHVVYIYDADAPDKFIKEIECVDLIVTQTKTTDNTHETSCMRFSERTVDNLTQYIGDISEMFGFHYIQ